MIIISPFNVLYKSKTIIGWPGLEGPEQSYVYLQKWVAKSLIWDIEGLALAGQRKIAAVVCVVDLLLSPYFPYLPCFFLSPFEVPFPGTEPSFFEKA